MAFYKSIPQMEEEITHNGKDEVNESRDGSTLRVRFGSKVPAALDIDVGMTYTLDGRDIGRNAAIEWMNRTARMFITSRNGYRESICEAVDNALKLFEVLDALYSSSNMKLEIRKGMIREGVRELIYVHNTLQSMTGIGEQIAELTDEGDVISPYDLHHLLKSKYLQNELTFIKGAASDPFIYAQAVQPGVQIGADMQQHAVLNFRKAQVVIGNRLSHLMSADRY